MSCKLKSITNRKENVLKIDFLWQYARATWCSTSHETSGQLPCAPFEAVETCEVAHGHRQEHQIGETSET